MLQGTYIVAPCSQDSKAVQGSLVRMARPLYQEDRMVEGKLLQQTHVSQSLNASCT